MVSNIIDVFANLVPSSEIEKQVPLELGKTLLALIWLVSGFFATTLR